MADSCSIGDPYLLHSYGQQKWPKHPQKDAELSASVYATHAHTSTTKDGYVTVTAQADGIHILDLSSLHPIISYTLGPSTTFSCPAVSRFTVEESQNICTTYAVIESSPDVSVDERGRTIWAWRSSISNTLDRSAQKKSSVVVPQTVSRIYAPKELPSRLLLSSPKGELTILNASNLAVQHTQDISESKDLLEVFVLAAKSCSFMSSCSVSTVVVIFYAFTKKIHVMIMGVSEEEGVVKLGSVNMDVPVHNSIKISCSTSGYISILDKNGTWYSHQLNFSSSHITPLSILSTPTIRLKSLKPALASLLSLSTSHTLLAVPTDQNSLALHIWDLQYSVLISSHNLSIPASLSYTPKTPFMITLIPASVTNSQALLVLSPHPSASGKSRASIFVIPYVTPPRSTLASAMGFYSASQPFMHVPSSVSFLPEGGLDPKKIAPRLASIKSPMEASQAFHRFVNGSAPNARDFSLVFVEKVFPAIWPQVEDVGVLLLESGFVRRGMGREGVGVLKSAWDTGKWHLVDIVLANVFDLSEDDIVEVLKFVVKHHRTCISPDAMQIDPPPAEGPSLSKYLCTIISYPTSLAPLRLAIRRHISDVEDVVCVLDVLSGWVKEWAEEEVRLLTFSRRDESGAIVWGVPAVKEPNPNLPPFERLLSFLQALLDTSFLNLIAYTPGHDVLRQLLSHLHPHISFIDMTEQLRGSLDPFVKAHYRALQDTKEGKDGKANDGLDWRKKRKAKWEKMQGGAIGDYRLEELVL